MDVAILKKKWFNHFLFESHEKSMTHKLIFICRKKISSCFPRKFNPFNLHLILVLRLTQKKKDQTHFSLQKHTTTFVRDAGNKPALRFKQMVKTAYNDNLFRICCILAKISPRTVLTSAKEVCGDEGRERFSVYIARSLRA